MQIGSEYSTATTADRIDGVEQSGVLDEEQRTAVAVGKPGADRDALVLLADADQPRVAGLARSGAANLRSS